MSMRYHVDAYSTTFEDAVAEYVTGQVSDRSEKTMMELYTKLEHARSFIEFCQRYIDLQGKRFFEVGCGTGYFSVAAAQAGAAVASTDIVGKAVGLAKMRLGEHGIDADIFESDLRDAPRSKYKAKFDFVFCFQVIEHIARCDQFRALENLFSFVAPGGLLFFDTENSMCPYDRHDSGTWLLRMMSKSAYDPIIMGLGKGLNFYEPSVGEYVQTRDYLSYDELVGAASISGFEIVNPYMPHEDKRQALRVMTGSNWLHDTIIRHFDWERYAPISLLLRKKE